MASYAPLSSEEGEAQQKDNTRVEDQTELLPAPPGRSRWWPLKRLFRTSVLVPLCLLAFAGLLTRVLLGQQPQQHESIDNGTAEDTHQHGDSLPSLDSHHPTTPDVVREPESCGQAAAEAQSLGCVFDLMLFGWVPPRCHDPELAAEFLSAIEPWLDAWYSDPSGTIAVSQAEVLRGELEHVYVPHAYHMLHCTHMWKKMHRSLLAGRPLDGYLADEHHTNHCQLQLMEAVARNDTGTYVFNKFSTCPWETSRQFDGGRLGWYRVINGKKVYRNP